MAKRKPKIADESLDAFLTRMHGKGIIATAAEALPPRTRDILPTPLSLDIALSGGIPDGTICLITGKPKSGKCVDSKTTFAVTNHGLLNLEELKTLSKIMVVSSTGEVQRVSSWYDNGIDDVVKINTKFGSAISVTHNHPLMILDNDGIQRWKNGQDIKIGDILLCRRGDNVWGNRSIDNGDAYVYGLLIGDGHITSSRIQLSTKDSVCYKAFVDFVTRRGGKVLTYAGKDHHFNSTKHGTILLREGFYIKKYKQVPTFIRTCNINNICNMLSGYFDADGTVEKSRVNATTNSETLAIQIKTILMNLGILSNIRIRHIIPPGQIESRKYWEISIQNIESIKMFKDCIDFRIPRKRKALESLCNRKSSTKCDTVPHLNKPITALQTAVVADRGYFLPKTMNNLRTTINRWKRGDRKARRDMVRKMLDQFFDYRHTKEYQAIELLIDPHLFFDQVTSLDIDTVHTADLSVPIGKSFLANGIVNHNTTLCLELLRNAQILDRPAFYINIEKRCTPALLSTIQGLDPKKLQVVPHQIDKPLTAEDYLNIIERIAKTQEKAVVVVDSIAALSTMTEQEEQIGSNKDMAGPAKLLSAFFRRAQQIVDSKNVILIFISQMMSNREPRGPKYVEKGGVAVQYACSVWLKVTWTQQWERNAETNAPDGHDMHITVQSSAMGRPLLPCVLPLRYGIGIDVVKDIVTTAENLGLIEKAGAWYSIPMFAGDGDPPKFQGLARLSNFLKENPDKLKQLETEVRDVVLPTGE
ncbi:MAG: hypothetical protein DRJ03_00220 [Chloroflexi bacterium]|nr:MAG: hypothetical protein DRJ03_00220 [Chloroflexota bacterium]